MFVSYHKNVEVIKESYRPYIIYFGPSKYSVGDGCALLCNDKATTALKNGCNMIGKRYYPIQGYIIQRRSCNWCASYKRDWNIVVQNISNWKVFIMIPKLAVV